MPRAFPVKLSVAFWIAGSKQGPCMSREVQMFLEGHRQARGDSGDGLQTGSPIAAFTSMWTQSFYFALATMFLQSSGQTQFEGSSPPPDPAR